MPQPVHRPRYRDRRNAMPSLLPAAPHRGAAVLGARARPEGIPEAPHGDTGRVAEGLSVLRAQRLVPSVTAAGAVRPHRFARL